MTSAELEAVCWSTRSYIPDPQMAGGEGKAIWAVSFEFEFPIVLPRPASRGCPMSIECKLLAELKKTIDILHNKTLNAFRDTAQLNSTSPVFIGMTLPLSDKGGNPADLSWNQLVNWELNVVADDDQFITQSSNDYFCDIDVLVIPACHTELKIESSFIPSH